MKHLPDILTDIVGVAGLALFGYGVWLVYQPASYICVGLVLMGAAYRAASGGAAPAPTGNPGVSS